MYIVHLLCNYVIDVDLFLALHSIRSTAIMLPLHPAGQHAFGISLFQFSGCAFSMDRIGTLSCYYVVEEKGLHEALSKGFETTPSDRV